MQIYRFGEFELDLDAFELKMPGKAVKLERRALDLLALLVRQPNRLVPRDEIIAALWPPNVVIDFDSGLNTLVRKVRTALGDSSDSPKFIETVPGRGYRFVAPVKTFTEPAPPASPAAPPPEQKPPRLPRSTLIATAIALLMLVAVSIAWLVVDTRSGPTRIAVLPFENLTGTDELAYLASGLAEETGTALAQIDVKDLRVIRVSAQGFAESSLSLADFGRRYGVDFVVQSSLRLDRQRIRVTSRLVRIADNEQVWSASIDRELTNVLGVQRELSTAIAEQVRLRLSPEFAAAIARRQTQNPAAYALYLKARFEWSKLTPAGTRRALEYFEQATKADPNYALAWAGLAFGAITSTRTADVAPMIAVPIARHALDEALRLGADLAETQYAQGYYSLFHELNRPAAEKAARAAIKLDPNNAQAHVLLGVSLMRAGDAVEGREMMRRARELEPMFALAFANSANVALNTGDPQGALEFSRQTIAIDPEFWLGHYYLGRAQLALGDLNAAQKASADAARFSDGHSLTYPARVEVLVRLGRQDEARELLKEAEERAVRQYMPPYTLGVLQALVGDKDAAFVRLDRAIEVHDVNLLGLEADPNLRSLRDDPRFKDLVHRCDCSFNPAAKR